MVEVGAPVRLAGVRGMIAQRMLTSLRDTAQLSFFCDIDAGHLVAARAAWHARGVEAGYEDLVMAALPALVAQFPLLSAREDEPGTIGPSPQLDISVAVSVAGGVVAPAVAGVQDKTLPQIVACRRELVARARSGDLKVAEMRRGTLTLSNLGMTRVDYFTPILNRPQTAIFGLGRIRQAAAVDATGGLAVRPLMGVSLTVDHRVIDGMPAGQVLSRFGELLESPAVGPA